MIAKGVVRHAREKMIQKEIVEIAECGTRHLGHLTGKFCLVVIDRHHTIVPALTQDTGKRVLVRASDPVILNAHSISRTEQAIAQGIEGEVMASEAGVGGGGDDRRCRSECFAKSSGLLHYHQSV